MDQQFAVLVVRLTPRASRSEVGAWQSGVLGVRVTEPPVEGQANEALCRLLARRLGVAAGRVRIIGGATARTKRVRVEGLSLEDVRQRLRASG
jgi:uncharacterized protein YggU (UPF0235/DUF167 family)